MYEARRALYGPRLFGALSGRNEYGGRIAILVIRNRAIFPFSTLSSFSFPASFGMDAQFGPSKTIEQWDILRRTFVFGVAAYVVTFCIYWVASWFISGLNF